MFTIKWYESSLLSQQSSPQNGFSALKDLTHPLQHPLSPFHDPQRSGYLGVPQGQELNPL